MRMLVRAFLVRRRVRDLLEIVGCSASSLVGYRSEVELAATAVTQAVMEFLTAICLFFQAMSAFLLPLNVSMHGGDSSILFGKSKRVHRRMAVK